MLTVADELEGWRKGLGELRDDKVAKNKLKELEALRSGDQAGYQNWLQSMFWLARKNARIAEVQKKVLAGGEESHG